MVAAPAVSIVICTRNRAPTLNGSLQALAAIESELPWEALLVDNASTDGTSEVLAAAARADPRLKHIFVDTIGLGAARDAGWRQTRGEIVAFTDDDCYLSPDYVDRLVEAFRERPALGCIGGRILLHDPEDLPVTIDEREAPEDIAPFSFVPAGALQGANLAFRRSALGVIGGIDPQLGAGTQFPCEDIDAVSACVWAGILAGYDPRPLVFHHHRRRAHDLDALNASYDRGRGAYYAKHLMNPRTRAAYLRGWWRVSIRLFLFPGMTRVLNETASATTYLAYRKRYGLMVLAGIFGFGMSLVVLGVVTARRLKHRFGQATGLR